MFDLIVQNFCKRICKKKSEPNISSNHTTSSKNNIIVEVDYEKLANALMRAEEKIRQEKEIKNKEEHEKLQDEWEKALKCQRYKGSNLLIKILYALFFPLRITYGIIFFSKKNATTENATYALFRICNNCILWTYKWLFYIIAICCSIVVTDTICPFISLGMQTTEGLVGYIGICFLCFIIGRIIRIAQLEAKNLQNKNSITVLFNALVAFTAMLLAIAGVIIALSTGGTCTCV